jgi:polyphosphate kinase
MLTADPEVGADVTDLFNVLTGYSRQTAFRRLLVAPHGVRKGLIERIDDQARIAREGGEALVQFKVNSLVDEETIDALYRASRDGVQIDLIIRGMCALRPGVAGLSDNIRVRSIVGRFLEHSRVFRFGAGDDAEYWIGSADLMHRNLDRRVEALVRVTLPSAQDDLRNVLELSMAGNSEGWDLSGDGTWHRRPANATDPHIHLQEALLRRIIGKKAG